MKVILAEELEVLRQLAATSADFRLSTLLVAADDDRVQELLAKKVANGHQYIGALVSRRGARFQVVFSFDRAEGEFGLLPQSVLVSVDLQERRVLQVVDNHLGELADAPEYADPEGLRPDLDLKALMLDRVAGAQSRLRPVTQRIHNGPDLWWV